MFPADLVRGAPRIEAVGRKVQTAARFQGVQQRVVAVGGKGLPFPRPVVREPRRGGIVSVRQDRREGGSDGSGPCTCPCGSDGTGDGAEHRNASGKEGRNADGNDGGGKAFPPCFRALAGRRTHAGTLPLPAGQRKCFPPSRTLPATHGPAGAAKGNKRARLRKNGLFPVFSVPVPCSRKGLSPFLVPRCRTLARRLAAVRRMRHNRFPHA